MLACSIVSHGPSTEKPPKWTTLWAPFTAAATSSGLVRSAATNVSFARRVWGRTLSFNTRPGQNRARSGPRMRPVPPAARVNTMRGEGSLTSAILGSFHEVAVALERARQVFAHRSPRIGRIAIGNRRHDAGVLPLDTLQIGPPFAGC